MNFVLHKYYNGLTTTTKLAHIKALKMEKAFLKMDYFTILALKTNRYD